MTVNKVTLVGRLGADPETKYMSSGDAVTNIRLATDEQWKDKQTGEKKTATEWHRVVLFGKVAEIAAQYLTKGAQVYLEGKIKTRKWTDQAGNDKYSTEVHCDVMKMLGGKSDGGEGGGGRDSNNGGQQRQQPRQQAPQGQRQPQQSRSSDADGDDIPF